MATTTRTRKVQQRSSSDAQTDVPAPIQKKSSHIPSAPSSIKKTTVKKSVKVVVTESSAKKSKLSAKESKSSAKESKSSVKESKSSVKESKSSVKESKSSVKESKPSAKESKPSLKNNVVSKHSESLSVSGSASGMPLSGVVALDDAPYTEVPHSELPRRRVIAVRGARVHNLKNVSVEIPRNKLVVITGVSGSGKSSLAFDTIYAEGQRRFMESLSAYARQFLERMAKPDVDSITGIPPAIAIQQKTVSRNPRSTVGTMTELYDYLRVFYGRIGTTKCHNCGSVVRKDTPQSTVQVLMDESIEGDKLYVLFPLSAHEKHTLAEEIENIKAQGFFRLVLRGSDDILDMNEITLPKKTVLGDVFVLADRLIMRKDDPDMRLRLTEAIETAFLHGGKRCMVRNLTTFRADMQMKYFSSEYECAECSIVYKEPNPRLFSFNSPLGACPTCEGFGRSMGIDEELVIPDRRKSLVDGAIHPFQTPMHSMHQHELLRVAHKHDISITKPIQSFTTQEMQFLWEGRDSYIGIQKFFALIEEQVYKVHYRVLLSRYRGYTRCSSCGGARLRRSARQVFIHEKSLPEIVTMTIDTAEEWFRGMTLTDYQEQIVGRVLKEIMARLAVLRDIGVGYLTLDRLAHTLSGGETQRINLATSIGSALVGALYVLDEPSIGLHPRDTERMIRIMHRLRGLGNTVIVVEHDEDIMRSADMIIDMGPRAGEHGGTLVFQGSPQEIMTSADTLTGEYLSGRRSIPIPSVRSAGHGTMLTLHGARQNNLKGDRVDIPLGCMTVITGVSGSGKSTLIHDVLYNGLLRKRGQPVSDVGAHDSITGDDTIIYIEMVDQSPIGKSPRSTPATYTKSFDFIREVFSATQSARQLGWKPGHFSFNVPGGRCERCEGDGMVKVEMQFLADVYLECESCKGTRYKKEAQTILFRGADGIGKSIVDILKMTVDEAIQFFAHEKRIASRLQVLHDVGLGYIRLGQPGTTLSGGEAQRIKLATYLQETTTAHTLFIFDEPTTGLHFDDIAKLLQCFQRLVTKGHSLIIVEHNPDVMKCADWIIDMGPDAGSAGGSVVASGTPETVAMVEASYTGQYLKKLFAQHRTV